MLGNVVIRALSVNLLAIVECMYCVHDGGFDLSSCPCSSTAYVNAAAAAAAAAAEAAAVEAAAAAAEEEVGQM